MDTSFATDLLNEFGADMDLVWFTDIAPPDQNKVWRSGGSNSVIQTVKGVFVRAQRWKHGLFTDSQMESTGVPSNERRVVVAAEGLTQAMNLKSELRSNGQAWQIVSIEPIFSGGDIAVYTMQVRQ